MSARPASRPGKHKTTQKARAAVTNVHRVAVVQHPPVLLDLRASISRAVELITEAATDRAELVTFPETFLPGYPEWVWRLRPGGDNRVSAEIHRQLAENAVDLEAGGLELVQRAARKNNVTTVIGINEREGSYGRSTLYNTVVTIGPDGTILNRHRKLMPTNPERMVWGLGDASGLRVVESPVGRIGSLICWENYMPLARYSIYAQGPDFYVAPTWDEGDSWIITMRHIAMEGRVWVLGNGTSIQGRDVPADFPDRAALFPDEDEWINPGDSVIVSPAGEIVAGPLHEQHGILYADCEIATAAARRTLDVTGHYSRPDIFSLEVMRAPSEPIKFSG
jgi:nitrilase